MPFYSIFLLVLGANIRPRSIGSLDFIVSLVMDPSVNPWRFGDSQGERVSVALWSLKLELECGMELGHLLVDKLQLG